MREHRVKAVFWNFFLSDTPHWRIQEMWNEVKAYLAELPKTPQNAPVTRSEENQVVEPTETPKPPNFVDPALAAQFSGS